MNHGESLEWLGLASYLFFVVVYAAHGQPVLAKRICQEIDAWFVLFQVTLVSLGACDALRWATRPTLLIPTAWLWSLWLLFLDAVPVATDWRLALSRGLVLLTVVRLAGLPVLDACWLYFSPHRTSYCVRFDAKLLGFVASKMAALWVWMGRFVWREIFRPRDAFKLVKRCVFYRIPFPPALNGE